MISIPDLDFRLKSDDHPISSIDCELSIQIKATSSQQDIKSISYVCILGSETYTNKIDNDILDSISTHFDLDIEDEIWNSESVMDINLAIQLDRLLATLTPEEINSVASPYTTIWNVDYPNNEEDLRQAFVNVFLAECSLYLVVCDLLWTHNAWNIFPFNWELPFEDLDSRIMSSSSIKYMYHAISTCAVVSAGITRPISWLIESFNNSFGVDYIEGEELSLTDLSKEMTIEVSKYNTTQASLQRDEMKKYVEKIVSDINTEYIEKQQYILDKLSEIQQSQIGILDKVNGLESVLNTHSSRLDTLEREVGDLSTTTRDLQSNGKDEDKPSAMLELTADVQQLTERIIVLESHLRSKKK